MLSSSPTTTTTVTAVIVLIITAVTALNIGLDSTLTQQITIDPKATKDSYLSLSSTLKNSLSQSLSPQSLFSLSLSVPVHVILIGDSFGSQSLSLLNNYLSQSLSQSPFHVITPFGSGSGSNSLSVSHSLSLSSSIAPKTLSEALSKRIAKSIDENPSNLRSPLVPIPYKEIDRIILGFHRKQKPAYEFDGIEKPRKELDQFEKPGYEMDRNEKPRKEMDRKEKPGSEIEGKEKPGNEKYEGEKPSKEIYIYIMNLGEQEKKYVYNYGSGTGESSPGYTKCSGSVWAGKDRYLWVDLGAGPVDYGPAISGEGVLPRGEAHPLAVLHGRPKSHKGLLADLASLVYSAYQVLLVPPLRIPVPFEDLLIVQFIHIYDSDTTDGKDVKGLDFKSVEETFMDEANGNELLLGDQTLKFKNYDVDYQKCSICSFAVAKALTTYTSRYLFNNYTLIVSEYLDSKRLHQILSESAEELRRVAKIPEEDFGRVLPVYVFDLNLNSILLFDRYHQTVSFKDMVVAVRTKSSQTVSDYSCNGRHVFTQTRELERPLVGSILQSMWGVSPTHLLWSSKHNSTLVDYTWSIGQTPFGPFSEISSLSFVQKDAARRNTILTMLNYSITSMADVLESLSGHGGDKKVLKPSQYTEFTQRWSLFKYKLDKVVTSLSHMEFDRALYFMKSSDHDLYAIHSIVYEVSQELEASLSCFKDPPFPWGSALMSGGVFCGLFYAYLKRKRLFSNKRKQF